MLKIEEIRIAVVGLGYVGLPLAVEFGKIFPVLGFDINKNRIESLKVGKDNDLEVDKKDIEASKYLTFSYDYNDLESCNVYIVVVPTPVDHHNQPDFSFLVQASGVVAKYLEKGNIVIYESTVYPGATEDICVPKLEEISRLKYNQDFFIGYSPERANPGDKTHRLTTIVKVTSGSTPAVADFIDDLYKNIVPSGTYKAESIQVAEAAKVIENTQRDLNIALMNELAIICNKLNIDTEAVLKAAGTKWNFLPFRPGLVGGHCVGVDPYYLTSKAQSIGYHPEIILAGRRLNDGMGRYVATQFVKSLLAKDIHVQGAQVLIMGFTFKENCPDIRNTRVIDIILELQEYKIVLDIYDPWVNPDYMEHEYGMRPIPQPENGQYDGIIVTVSHAQFKDLGVEAVRAFGKGNHVLYDIKCLYPKEFVDLRL